MKNLSTNLKTMVIAGGALFMAMAAPLGTGQGERWSIDLISAASAAEDGHEGHQSSKGTKGGSGKMLGGGKGGQQAGGSGSGPGAGSGKGSKSLESAVLQPKVAEDSDRPPWAGAKGGKAGGGTKPPGAGTKKGDLYGDLYVLIRDPVTGVALTEVINGVTYPLVQAYDTNGVLLPGVSIPRDAEGNLILTTYTTKEVEFGRLSVGRAPTKVMDHSLTEALTKLAEADASSTDNIYITLDAGGRLVIVTDGVAKAIDSPLENLALYVAIANLSGTNRTINDGSISWTVPDSINIDLLKASLLAAAADKTGTITLDTVMYTNPVLKVSDDLSTFSYDRAATYSSVYVTVLVPNADGTVWTATKISVYDAVFKSTNLLTPAGATDFAQAANDALQVIEFIHEYAVPVLPAP